MGLENGIYVKPKTAKAENYLLENWEDIVLHEAFKLEDKSIAYQIGYFIKFWGLRKDILTALGMTKEEQEDSDLCGEHSVTRLQFKVIYDILCKHINKEYYEEVDGYWDYHIAARMLGEVIWTIGCMIEDFDALNLWDEVELGFYDSP